MDEFLLVVLCVAVFWLVVRQLSRGDRERQAEQLAERFASLERRLSRLEDAARTAAAVKPTVAAPVQQGGPFAAATPVKPAEPTDAKPAAQVVVNPEYPGFSMPKVVVPPVASEPSASPVPTARMERWPAAPAPTSSHLLNPYVAPREERVAPPPTEPAKSLSFEERFGRNWLNKLGIVILVIGVASGAGYWLRTLGPAGKSAAGMTLSLALLAGGLWLEKREPYRIFAWAMIGGGWALTFFLTFALYHVSALQVLHSQAVDLVLMLIVALAMVGHSLHYKSQVVTSIAFLLAFATVGISEVTLFSLVAGALLAGGLVWVAARERWYGLAMFGLAAAYLNHYLWLARVLPDGGVPGHPFAEFLPSAALLLFYWLLYRLFYVLRVPQGHRQEVLSSATAVLNSVGLMSLLKYQSSHPEWAFWGLLVLGLAEMVLAFVARRRYHNGFVVLACIASVLLVAAVPFRFSGSNWTLLWLLETEMLFLAGIALREPVLRRLGGLASFVTTMQLLVVGVASVYSLRQDQVDLLRHPAVAISLFTAAAVFWFNAEFATRRWNFIAEDVLDRGMLAVTTYLAAACAALGLWVFFPGTWTAVAWLVLTLALGLVVDRLRSTDLATQTDLIAVAALVRVVLVNFQMDEHWGRLTLRAISVGICAALLYANMRRKTRSVDVGIDYIPIAYSWTATGLLAALVWFECSSLSIAVVWGAMGLVLFEIGLGVKRSYWRHQAYALVVASFGQMLMVNMNLGVRTNVMNSRTYTVTALIVAYFWVYERLNRRKDLPQVERVASSVAAWIGLAGAAVLVFHEVREEWVTIAWAVMSLMLIVVGWMLKRRIFVGQALVLLVAAAVQAVLWNLLNVAPMGRVNSRSFCVGLACAVMVAALPVAFQIRKQWAGSAENDWRRFTVYRPEQPFFFVPLALVTALLAVELRAGMITIGWCALGVATFLFALTVKERSFRLAGLGLLMLGVLKILVIDIWQASPSDRYITLIVMGAALLLVSFLYSKYRETLLKLL